ncbi:unnamed protein product [Soboliphyme baturini]|uniref:Peptidase_M13 domain-containing protein n=1 Tax=Soboliphyme baturini TaxID=241478 RepID=A0A183J673_9BILA|nr:unnamed protein product [Soboliphyme baturini]
MDDKSKLLAIRKVDNLIASIAYSRLILNDTILEQMYCVLTSQDYGEDNFFQFFSKVVSFRTSHRFRSLKLLHDRTEFRGPSTIVNAWYKADLNTITLPAAIFTAPIFDATFPMAVNYGFVGALIGHELIHGFDNQVCVTRAHVSVMFTVRFQGVQFFENGLLHSWMSEQSQANFDRLAECMVEQYSQVCYAQVNRCVSGNRTLAENIADNGGMNVAYRAYQTYIYGRGADEAPLPGFENYTLEQVFFMAYGKLWCMSSTSRNLLDTLQFDTHSPNVARVNEVLKNSPAFQKAFGCSTENKMHTDRICEIW